MKPGYLPIHADPKALVSMDRAAVKGWYILNQLHQKVSVIVRMNAFLHVEERNTFCLGRSVEVNHSASVRLVDFWFCEKERSFFFYPLVCVRLWT